MGLNYSDNQSLLMVDYAKKYIEQSLKGVNREDLPYILTYTGKKFRHAWPLAEDVCVEDVAHSLSLLNRFTGHTKKEYSVAQHSVMVSYLCDPKYALDGLHHDDSEAYYQDLSRPLKRLPGMEFYRVYEKMGAKAVEEAFGLGPEPQNVKDTDARLLVTELRDLFDHVSNSGLKPYGIKIIPWTPEQAEQKFLQRHYELTGDWVKFWKDKYIGGEWVSEVS